MQFIKTDKAPQAIGPYSQAVVAGDFIYTSGQVPLNSDGVLVEGDIKAQTKQVLTNLSEVLKKAKSSLKNVVKTTIF